MLASSRPGTQPATLQGIWNDKIEPPWGSKYTANINLQMNYWLADPANLSECMEPLIRLAEELSITGAEIAAAHYGARGWVLHHNTDIWRAAGPVDGAKWGLWPTGGAWLCAAAVGPRRVPRPAGGLGQTALSAHRRSGLLHPRQSRCAAWYGLARHQPITVARERPSASAPLCAPGPPWIARSSATCSTR